MVCPNCRRDITEYSNFCYFCGTRQHVATAGPAPAQKRLMRSAVDSKIAGVCGGIAEYLGVDSTIIRLIWVLLIFLPVPIFPAFIGYFVAWLVMPQAPLPVYVATAPQAQAPQATAPHTT
jgi:phage shock protein PspC (stress-responsive transcriptional regulator)